MDWANLSRDKIHSTWQRKSLGHLLISSFGSWLGCEYGNTGAGKGLGKERKQRR